MVLNQGQSLPQARQPPERGPASIGRQRVQLLGRAKVRGG